MPRQLTNSKVLVASAAVTATANSGALTLPIADIYTFVVNVTTVTGTTPTLDIVFQNTPDDGTTWINMPMRTAQLTAASANYFNLPASRAAIADSNATAATGGILSKNYIPSRKIRILYTVGGTNPSFTFGVYMWSSVSATAT